MFRRFLVTLALMASVFVLIPATGAMAAGTVINYCSPQLKQAVHYGYTPRYPSGYQVHFLQCGQGESGVYWLHAGRRSYDVTVIATGRVMCRNAGVVFYPTTRVRVTPHSHGCD